MIFFISLFFFFASFFFFLYPTVKRQLLRMQQGDYYYEKFLAFMKTQRKVESVWVLASFIFSSYLLQQMEFISLEIYLLLHGLALLVLGLLHLKKTKEPAPRFDARMVRLCVVSGGIVLGLFLLLAALFKRSFLWEMPFVMMFLGFMTDTWILLGNFILQPFEKGRAKRAIAMAAVHMEEIARTRAAAGKPPLHTVAVSGSYGKSGFIAAAQHLLSVPFLVLASEAGKVGSLTAAGTLVTQSLTEQTDVLLLEVSSRHLGDVARFCESIPPEIGVLTSVCERNMETFLSFDRIVETQMELSRALAGKQTQGNAARLFCDYDDEQIRKLKLEDGLPVRYGTYRGVGKPQHLDVYASNVRFYPEHTEFTLTTSTNQTRDCRLAQPGKYALEAAIGAASLALSLGIPLQRVQSLLATMPPLPGYLTLLPVGGWPDAVRKALARPWEIDGVETRQNAPFQILDDTSAFCLNSAKDSLAMLGFADGYRLCITPGLRDQGESEDEVNRQIGRQAARCCDELIVVGKEKFSVIEDGAQRAGYHTDHLHLAVDFKEAVRRARALAENQGGDGEAVYLLFLGRFV